MAFSNVEQFMTDWRSQYFRERIVAQIETARQRGLPNPNSEDQMEKFLAQNSSQHLEEFVFEKATAREHYLELIADLLLYMRQCKKGRSAGNPGSSSTDEPDLPNGTTSNGDHTETTETTETKET